MPKTKPFADLVAKIQADPARRERLARERWSFRAALALAEARRRRGLSQEALAHSLGVSQARVSSIERGTDLQVSTLQSYIEALGGRLEVRAVFPGETISLTAQPGIQSEALAEVPPETD